MFIIEQLTMTQQISNYNNNSFLNTCHFAVKQKKRKEKYLKKKRFFSLKNLKQRAILARKILKEIISFKMPIHTFLKKIQGKLPNHLRDISTIY